ncbi:hypothetical protein PHISCL_07972 [Aspergillus sclerotialis]|uniref:Uncharacterized protein n=1 Tax=Aspergillus sclerotialis TaxID=2070753 RepID=A0A3A2ZEE7_9EURO|nr:hypothetical protein PHISCL_07972 [Aspergillus sclerotialis]
MASTTPNGAGGFIPPPSASPASSSSASTVTPSHLPRQRSHPLRAGSMKETTLINHVDKTILAINRRHAKKFSSRYEAQDQDQQSSERGYENFKEVVRDIEPVVDLVWVSGTPSLQIPYLISLSVLVNSFLPAYPFTPRATFRLLRKLDCIFASLLTGQDAETESPLPGFENRRDLVSMTEKVRIKSIVESCRVAVVETRGQEGDGSTSDGSVGATEEEDEDDLTGSSDLDGFGEPVGRWEMEAARVYEKTIQLLGDELGKQGELEGGFSAC